MKTVVLSIVLCLLISCSYGQINRSINKESLLELKADVKKENLNAKNRIRAFVLANPSFKGGLYTRYGKQMIIEDIINGLPVLRATYNRTASITTGTDFLKKDGGLGLDLSGEGMEVVMWDGGRVNTDHQEFGSRVVNWDGGDLSDHSSHVMGTILASGVNPAAEGMATKAEARAFDFENDTQEMIDAAIGGLVLSNHSYGSVAGWSNGIWVGDNTLSTDEDWKFGFYDSRAREWDQVALDAPHYLIVKGAGNDRGESGDGSHPADGTYDCISTYGTAKNILTVGAVEKISGGYIEPADVVMSSFSSWGPTDDGRIKPDIVGVGVGVFSCLDTPDDGYGIMQGTSMSTPNVTGSLLLLQELHEDLKGHFMRSSTMKALVIHTAHESGFNPGPDYKHGWGLLNAKGAAEVLLEENGVNEIIVEDVITSGGEYLLELNPVLGSRIKATLVWTDVPGTPVPVSLDPITRMLVNDLDMRIDDGAGNVSFPWTLDPNSPTAAALKGDNSRDNVEVIEIDDPNPISYTLRISHKGSLVNGSQSFSLIISYESQGDALSNLYWIGNEGNWSDGNNWSFNSGGAPAGVTPASTNKVIYDNNSFTIDGQTSLMDGDYACGGIVWFSNSTAVLDLGGNDLLSSGDVLLESSKLTLVDGTLRLSNDNVSRSLLLNLNKTLVDDIGIVLETDNQAIWKLNDQTVGPLLGIIARGGVIEIQRSNVQVNSLIFLNEQSLIPLDSSDFSNLRMIDFGLVAHLSDTLTTYSFDENIPGSIVASQVASHGFINAGDLRLEDVGGYYNRIEVTKSLVVQGTGNRFRTLVLMDADLKIMENTELHIYDDIVVDNINTISIMSSAFSRAAINIEPHKKYCFDNLNITKVDIVGNSSMNAGLNSTVSESDNWFEVECDDLLFADFTYDKACEESLATLTDVSTGNVVSREWIVGGEVVSTDEVFQYNFGDEGEYEVIIKVFDGSGSITSYSSLISVGPSDLLPNEVIQNDTELVSLKPADSYQWYKDDQLIVGATERTYEFNEEPGAYFVTTFSENCNRQSALWLVTSVFDPTLADDIVLIPNPTRDRLEVKITRGGDYEVQVINLLQEIIMTRRLNSNSSKFIDLEDLAAGVYIIKVSSSSGFGTKRLLKI